MSVKRRDLVKFFERHGFYLLRQSGNHSIDSDGNKVIPVKRHRSFDRITAYLWLAGSGLIYIMEPKWPLMIRLYKVVPL